MKLYIIKYSRKENRHLLEFEMFRDNFFVDIISIMEDFQLNLAIEEIVLTIGENSFQFYDEIINCKQVDRFKKLYFKFKTDFFGIYKINISSTDKSFAVEIDEEIQIAVESVDYNDIVNFIIALNKKIPDYFRQNEIDIALKNENRICMFGNGLLMKKFDSYEGIMNFVKNID